MKDSMKALSKQTPGPGLKLVEVEKPEVGHNDVMIRVRKTAICGTDVHIWKWDEWARKPFPCRCTSATNMSGASWRWAGGAGLQDRRPRFG